MAVTSNTYTGNGTNKLFSITFPYLNQSDVKVYLNNTLQTITTQYTFANLTQIEFVTAPANGAVVTISRVTNSDTVEAEFFNGSPIRATDLNDNSSQGLYLIQETQNSLDAIDDKAQSAVDAVSLAFPFILVANLAALNALTPVLNSYYELKDSTGATTPTVTSIPVGLVGSSGLTFRLRYNGTSFVFQSYYANDSETRYIKPSSNFYIDTVNNRIGINTTSPDTTLDIRSQGTTNIRGAYGRHADNTTAASQFKWIGSRSRGTLASPTAVQANDTLVSFNGGGYKASAWSDTVGGYYVYAAENWTNSATGSYLTLRGCDTGGTTVNEWARMDQNGFLLTNQRDLRFGDSDNSNWVALQSPSVVASNVTWTLPATDSSGTQALTSNGSGTLAWASYGSTHATAVTPSSTAVQFLSIPSWVNRIALLFDNISSSGTSAYLIQLGDSGGFETTGYNGCGSRVESAATSSGGSTAGFILPSNSSSSVFSGFVFITRLSGNIWTAQGSIGDDVNNHLLSTAGSKTLSDVLDRVRLTTVNGTDTFDASGTLNISYNP